MKGNVLFIMINVLGDCKVYFVFLVFFGFVLFIGEIRFDDWN